MDGPCVQACHHSNSTEDHAAPLRVSKWMLSICGSGTPTRPQNLNPQWSEAEARQKKVEQMMFGLERLANRKVTSKFRQDARNC